MTVLCVVPVNSEDETQIVRTLFREYAASLPIDLEYQEFSVELRNLPGVYQPPRGGLFVAQADGLDVGCVAIRPLHDGICEMKRLYVRPAHRGAGVGSLLVETAIAAARALGYEEMWLDTLPTMTTAHQLYLSRGFRDIASYGGPAAPGTRYYGLRLTDARQATGDEHPWR